MISCTRLLSYFHFCFIIYFVFLTGSYPTSKSLIKPTYGDIECGVGVPAFTPDGDKSVDIKSYNEQVEAPKSEELWRSDAPGEITPSSKEENKSMCRTFSKDSMGKNQCTFDSATTDPRLKSNSSSNMSGSATPKGPKRNFEYDQDPGEGR